MKITHIYDFRKIIAIQMEENLYHTFFFKDFQISVLNSSFPQNDTHICAELEIMSFAHVIPKAIMYQQF